MASTLVPLTASGKRRASFWLALRGAALAGVLAALYLLLLKQGPALAAWHATAAGAAAALAVLVLAWPLFEPFFGPIFFYDLVTSARRGRQVLLRCLYIAGLMLMVALLYWQGVSSPDPRRVMLAPAAVRRAELADFNERFFEAFMAVQYLVVLLLTPGLCSGAIADERERKTLDYLFTTDLANREIVLGKLLARMLTLALILFAGLPVLSLMQLLGGIDPNLMAAGFVATLATMLSLGSLGLFNSVTCTRPRTAMALTYVQVGAYFLLTSAALWVWDPSAMPWPVRLLCGGNIYVSLSVLQATVATPTGVTLVSVLPGVLLSYLLVHLSIAVAALLAATLGLRVWARWQASARGRRSFLITFTQKRLPPVGHRPLWWKEVHAEPLFRLGKTAMILVTTAVTMTLLFGAFILIAAVTIGLTLNSLPQTVNSTVRPLGTFVAVLSLLGIAVRAAGAIGGERDRMTLDSLLTTPVENHAIVLSKWWGSILGVRKAVLCLLVIWITGVATGGLSLLAFPLLVGAWLVLACFVASLGLWFSLVCRTTLRATVWTLATLAGLWLGHWLLTLCCSPLAYAFSGGSSVSLSSLMEMQFYVLTPPAAFSGLAFYESDVLGIFSYTDNWGSHLGAVPIVLCCLFGLALYGTAGAVLYLLCQHRFGPVTGRLPLPGHMGRRRPLPAADRRRSP